MDCDVYIWHASLNSLALVHSTHKAGPLGHLDLKIISVHTTALTDTHRQELIEMWPTKCMLKYYSLDSWGNMKISLGTENRRFYDWTVGR